MPQMLGTVLFVMLAALHVVRSSESQVTMDWVQISTINETENSGSGCYETPDWTPPDSGAQGTDAERGLSSCETLMMNDNMKYLEFYPRSFETIGGYIRYYRCYGWRAESCTLNRTTKMATGVGDGRVYQFIAVPPSPGRPPRPPPPTPSPPPPCTENCPPASSPSPPGASPQTGGDASTDEALPDDVVEIIMTAPGRASDYTYTKQFAIKAAMRGALAGMGVTGVGTISVLITNLDGLSDRRRLQSADGVSIAVSFQVPASSAVSAADVRRAPRSRSPASRPDAVVRPATRTDSVAVMPCPSGQVKLGENRRGRRAQGEHGKCRRHCHRPQGHRQRRWRRWRRRRRHHHCFDPRAGARSGCRLVQEEEARAGGWRHRLEGGRETGAGCYLTRA